MPDPKEPVADFRANERSTWNLTFAAVIVGNGVGDGGRSHMLTDDRGKCPARLPVALVCAEGNAVYPLQSSPPQALPKERRRKLHRSLKQTGSGCRRHTLKQGHPVPEPLRIPCKFSQQNLEARAQSAMEHVCGRWKMTLRRPIVRLDSLDSQNRPVQVLVRPKPMSERLVSLWHKHVQPLVDANYVYSQQARPGLRVRADVGWKWRRILTLARIWDAYAPLSESTRSLSLCLTVELGSSGDFPIGMLTVVPGFVCSAFGQERCRSFAWYLSDAPKEVYTGLLRRHPLRGVAHALVDCSVQAGLEIGGDGMLLLHADPRGGNKLHHFYRVDCGMTQLPAGDSRISPLRFTPSEEYFHFDVAQANAYCSRFDHRR